MLILEETDANNREIFDDSSTQKLSFFDIEKLKEEGLKGELEGKVCNLWSYIIREFFCLFTHGIDSDSLLISRILFKKWSILMLHLARKPSSPKPSISNASRKSELNSGHLPNHLFYWIVMSSLAYARIRPPGS